MTKYSELLDSIVMGNISKFKKLIATNIKPNDINLDGKGELLFYASESENMLVIINLTKLGADWFIKNDDGSYFIDYLSDDNKKMLSRLFPEKYKEYLIKKETDKYNL